MISDKDILDAKILIIDDEQAHVDVLKKILNIAGYNHIKGITDARDIVSIIGEFLPDIVLLDLMMPFMDGFEVMDTLKKKNNSYLPILVLSGLQDDESFLRALDLGAKDFIRKPFNFKEVLAKTRNLLEVALFRKKLENQNHLLEDKVSERTKELNASRLEVIRRLVMAAEYRDSETGLHILRMSKMCSLIGKAVSMSETQSELLLHASPMHDIGKIGIPDNILLKPGKLDPNEWKTMQTHTIIGAKLVSGNGSELMNMASIIALTHHEKWDGTGYPHGLAGEDIPMEGRIASLCDVFDALISNRPYKKAWSNKDSFTEIYRNSGKHFDPKLVEIFKEILPDILIMIKEST